MQIFQSKEIKEQDKADFEVFLEKKKLQKMIKNSVVFKYMKDEDVLPLATFMTLEFVDKGENIIHQGKTTDECMFFVATGSFEFVDERKGNKIVGEAKVGDSFGELALLFKKPRALSVRAKEETSSVWALNQEYLFQAVIENDLLPQVLQDLRHEYKQYGLLERILKSKEEVLEIIEVASRPKKKKTSLHSFLSTITFGVLATTWLPFLAPGIKNGWPQVFDIMAPIDTGLILQQQVTQLMLSLVGILGTFRFSRGTPKVRIQLFRGMLWVVVTGSLISISNLNSFDYFILDAWSLPVRLLLFGTTLGAYLDVGRSTFKLMKGPKQKSWMSNTFYESRARAMFSNCFLGLFLTMVVLPGTCMIWSKEWFYSVAVPLYRSSGFDLCSMFCRTQAVAYASLGALIATFQHEKRFRPRTCSFVLVATMALTNGDVIKNLMFSLGVLGSLPNMQEYEALYSAVYKPLCSQLKFFKFNLVYWGGLTVAGLLMALKRSMQEKWKHTGD
eukprot:CAMPEP_0194389706 /NCGR_PEP_ID=MMETSP0174-20130528/105533_1 /TAXON_ID=216777 /ORGANISM="Proboscia alata, Strain PI-D3" /LENGTH=501 /DNA_ID=CAMNT_0039182215 /DNA_START=272 /DNA_END=1777 /DNA_ORIENTATION=+